MKLNSVSIQYLSNKICVSLFVLLLKFPVCIGYHFQRMDLETCLGQFDVHRGTIIRTEESQAIGGKYLQGIGLNNLDECQRLCCETEHCDVYIFEEKAEGYCYLFECGPPENFHCKFTRHANYTSAVLTQIRHIVTSPSPTPPKSSIVIHQLLPPQPILPVPVSQQIPSLVVPSLSQHELELTNLKQKPEVYIQQSKIFTTTIPSLGIGIEGRRDGGNGNSGNGGIHQSEQIPTPKSPQMNASICGRFQFQCHSGECIAVYNACDGIPQCEDGSDEGPECPTTTGVDTKFINVETSRLNDMTNYIIPVGNGAGAAVGLSKQTMQILPRQYQQSPVQSPVINNREDPMSAPSVWQNRRVQQDTQAQVDKERNSHIFNHKGGLQLPANNLGQPYVGNSISNIYNPLQRDMYVQTDIQNTYQNPITQSQDHMIPPPNVNWQQTQIQQQPQQQQSLIPPGPYVIAVNGQPVPQVKSSLPNTSSQSKVNDDNNKNNNNKDIIQSKTDSVTKTNNDNQKIVLKSDNDKKTTQNDKDHDGKEKESKNEKSEDYSYYEDKSTEPPRKKQRKHETISSKEKDKVKNDQDEKKNLKEEKYITESPLQEQYRKIQKELEMEFGDHDGKAERPAGAVLSLTLGVILTTILGILVVCRLRMVGRRVRRIGKTPYAHDADFLVNGMYL